MTTPLDPPTTPDACTEVIDDLLDDLDSVAIFDALQIVADALSIDLTETMMRLKIKFSQGQEFMNGPEAVVQDLIMTSQSNPARAIDRLYRSSVLHDHREDLLAILDDPN
jgi:hypothetical protein